MLNSSRDKHKARTDVGGGGRIACYVIPDLSYEREGAGEIGRTHGTRDEKYAQTSENSTAISVGWVGMHQRMGGWLR